jgi:hypothetical protein
MMMPDRELEAWTTAWRSRDARPAGLRARVERQSRVLRVLWIGEIAITVAFGGGTLGWALRSRRPDVIALAAGVAVFLTLAWAFAIRNRRGIWGPETLTTAAYLELSILRCERRLQALTFSVVMYAAILAFNLAWVYHATDPASGLWSFLTSPSILTVWTITAALGLTAAWHRRRVKVELGSLEGMRRQIEEPGGRLA